MIRNVLEAIDGIGIWPTISLAIFFLFFVTMGWWVFRVDKKYIQKMKQLPLNGDEDTDSNQKNHDEK